MSADMAVATSAPVVTVRLAAGGKVHVAPAAFLGASFGVYRAACAEAGSRYDGAIKCQTARLDQVPRLVAALRAAGFAPALAADVVAAVRGKSAEVAADVTAADGRADIVDDALRARGLSLYQFQRDGVRWLAGRTAALLSDDMGLGKTIQALVAVPAGAPVLVVCPASLKGNWSAEAARWRPDLRPVVLAGRNSFRWPVAGEMILVNYDILPAATKDGRSWKLDVEAPPAGVVVIADEAHAIKSPKARRTQGFRALARMARAAGGRTWLLTGTPLLNRPSELWAVLDGAGLAKDAFGSYPDFIQMFGGRETRFGLEWGTPDAARTVPALRRVSLRRRMDDVLPDMPAKRWETIHAELTPADQKAIDRALAALAVEDGRTWQEIVAEALTGSGGSIAFERMSGIRAALATAKVPAMLALVEQYEEAEEPLLVFSAHRAPVDALGAREGWATITGDTPAADRQGIVDRFQAGELRGLALTIAAGGVGLTLTRARVALFVDLAWTPAINEQAEGRLHRIGQRYPQRIVRLVADHPMDERVLELLDEKRGIVAGSVDAAAGAAVEAPALVDELEAAQVVALPEPVATPAGQRTVAPPAPPTPRRPASTPAERWAAAALVTLAGLDPDHAGARNDVGFNRMDGAFGHKLAREVGGLTERQWAAAIRLCLKYRRQVGPCPTAA